MTLRARTLRHLAMTVPLARRLSTRENLCELAFGNRRKDEGPRQTVQTQPEIVRTMAIRWLEFLDVLTWMGTEHRRD